MTAPGPERRAERRAWWHGAADLLFGAFRVSWRLAGSFYAAFGIVVLAGFVLAGLGTLVFATLAGEVREGDTQRFDEAVLLWLAQHRSPLLDRAQLEITALGTGLVVLMVVGVAALFLWLTRHRLSAALLLVATAGGILLNGILKLGFARPRPSVVPWLGDPVSSSFPSGHAMSAAIVYGTVAYLAGRLQERRWTRALTALVALVVIAGISVTRLYLGVHYPSDVAAGIVVGFAWSAFCMATLEVMAKLAKRRAPEVLEQEKPPGS